MVWSGVILGEVCSKANSRRLVKFGDRPAFVKSTKALDYQASAIAQIRPPVRPIEDDVVLHATIYYRTRRPDLDESLLCDVLQRAGVIANDRQIKEKHIYHGLDKDMPRAEVRIEVRA